MLGQVDFHTILTSSIRDASLACVGNSFNVLV